jgi:chromosome segregation ATPase
MDIEKVVAALAEYGREMAESDPAVQELRAEVERLKQELSDSTNHYNGIINDLVKLRDEASAEVEQVKIGSDSAVQALHEHIRVQKSISDAHYESYCEMLKRIDVVARERDEAREEVERLKGDVANQMEINHAVVTMKVPTRLEPSRLEIAAMLVAGRFSNTVYVTEVKGTWIKYALDGADALIAAAKEVTK